jgi:Flp pilus assembly protein TadD
MALIIAAAGFALVLRAAPATAVQTDEPAAPAAPASTENKDDKSKTDAKAKTDEKDKADTKDKAGATDKTDGKDKAGETKTDKKSERQFFNGYRHAYGLIYRQHDYAAGIAALRALGHDDHSDVATMIGYASRRLGRYDEARFWYAKALAANPRNQRTLSYMGMWHAEQGNRLKAQDYLQQVRLICGNTECREYRELKGVIAGTATY